MEHIKDTKCTRSDCGGTCPTCTLFVCSVCGLFEDALTTDCPGVPSFDKSEDIYKTGKLDFRDGAWVEEPNPTNQQFIKWRGKIK